MALVCMRRLRLSGILKNRKQDRIEERDLPKPMFILQLEDCKCDIIVDTRFLVVVLDFIPLEYFQLKLYWLDNYLGILCRQLLYYRKVLFLYTSHLQPCHCPRLIAHWVGMYV